MTSPSNNHKSGPGQPNILFEPQQFSSPFPKQQQQTPKPIPHFYRDPQETNTPNRIPNFYRDPQENNYGSPQGNFRGGRSFNHSRNYSNRKQQGFGYNQSGGNWPNQRNQHNKFKQNEWSNNSVNNSAEQSFTKFKANDISQYFHASMLEDPWAKFDNLEEINNEEEEEDDV